MTIRRSPPLLRLVAEVLAVTGMAALAFDIQGGAIPVGFGNACCLLAIALLCLAACGIGHRQRRGTRPLAGSSASVPTNPGGRGVPWT